MAVQMALDGARSLGFAPKSVKQIQIDGTPKRVLAFERYEVGSPRTTTSDAAVVNSLEGLK